MICKHREPNTDRTLNLPSIYTDVEVILCLGSDASDWNSRL